MTCVHISLCLCTRVLFFSCCVCVGVQVEVLWVVSQKQAKWEAALPKETADVLNAGRASSSGALAQVKGAAQGLLRRFGGAGGRLSF